MNSYIRNLTTPVRWFFNTGTRNLVKVNRLIGMICLSTPESGPSIKAYIILYKNFNEFVRKRPFSKEK